MIEVSKKGVAALLFFCRWIYRNYIRYSLVVDPVLQMKRSFKGTKTGIIIFGHFRRISFQLNFNQPDTSYETAVNKDIVGKNNPVVTAKNEVGCG